GGLNQASMEVVMKLEAMMKIRIPGVRARARKVSTSLALKRAPMTLCRCSKESFTRLRNRRTSRRRKTIRLRLNSAKTIRLDAKGIWGAQIGRASCRERVEVREVAVEVKR